MKWVKDCLESKGNAPRIYVNTLLFLAPDEKNLDGLLNSLAERKAWQTIKDDKIKIVSKEKKDNVTIENENIKYTGRETT